MTDPSLLSVISGIVSKSLIEILAGCVIIVPLVVIGAATMLDELEPVIVFNTTDAASLPAEISKLLSTVNEPPDITRFPEGCTTGLLIVRVVAVIFDGTGSPAGTVVSTPSATIEMELFDVTGSLIERVGTVRFSDGKVLPEIEIESFPLEKSLLSEETVIGLLIERVPGLLIERVVAERFDGIGSPTGIWVSTPSATIVMKLFDTTDSLVGEGIKPLLISIAIPWAGKPMVRRKVHIKTWAGNSCFAIRIIRPLLFLWK